MADFSTNFKKLRQARHLSQTQLAERLGVSKSAVSMHENGNRQPSFEDAEKIADFFNVDLNYLLGHSESVTQLTGTPEDDPAVISAKVSAEELAVVKAYRQASLQLRAAARAVLDVKL